MTVVWRGGVEERGVAQDLTPPGLLGAGMERCCAGVRLMRMRQGGVKERGDSRPDPVGSRGSPLSSGGVGALNPLRWGQVY